MDYSTLYAPKNRLNSAVICCTTLYFFPELRTYNYTYNAENQLTQVRRASDNSLIAAYNYNYNGLRKSKTVNGVTTNFHWDAFGNLVRESDTNGNTLAIYYYDSGGNLVGLKKNSQYYVYHKNLRGDIVTVTQYNKAIQAQYGYDPWGAQTSYTGTLVQPFTYAGYYCDAETGLYYLKSRYYNPTLGRFLTRDSYEFVKQNNPQTLNLYVYCDNNPVNKTDPTGHIAFADDVVEAVVIAAFFAALSVATWAGSDAADELRRQIIDNVSESIETLKAKAENIGGPSGVQYSLCAIVSGYYRNVRGGTIYLNAGDVWKYGETTDPNGRYSQTWLDNNNLLFNPEYYGNQYECKAVEKAKLLKYFKDNWTLPPGNKIFR